MTTTLTPLAQRLGRPRLDVNPDAPLRFNFGWAADRAGTVFALTAPRHHGQPNPNHQVVIGSVQRVGRRWVAHTLDGMPFTRDRQQDAAGDLFRWTVATLNRDGAAR